MRASPKGDVEKWVRAELRELEAYHVPDSAGLIKLDAMENPYRLPAKLVPLWLERLREVPLNRYPDPHARELRARLTESLGIPASHDIMLGNGSDELIQIVIMAMAGEGTIVLAPAPSFVMYGMIARFLRVAYTGVELTQPNFDLDMPAMRLAIAARQPAVIFLAYPNNPSGNLWRREDIDEILKVAPGIVVIDEAYAPFAADSYMGDLENHDNLLVMRTFSKMGLAGLRLGYLCGPRRWLEQFNKVRLPYNINSLTQASAAFALDNAPAFAAQAADIRAERARLLKVLRNLPEVSAFPSETNFVLIRVAGAAGIWAEIKRHGVLIKNLSASGLLHDCLRVTVGTAAENASFTEALRHALASADQGVEA